MTNCLVCDSELITQPPGYWSQCTQCGFAASILEADINSRREVIDESLRHAALQPLRLSNYQRILDRLSQQSNSASGSLLDVGCAHGWFMRAAQDVGYRATGIEPDMQMAEQALALGLNVRVGYFPDALPVDVRFDVITFLDVFEHLPNLPAILSACHNALAPKGLLAISLPSSQGTFFRVARQMSRLGIHGPLDRMWQRGFPSPHLSYFHPEGLERFLSQHGFREVHREALPSLVYAGLWQRLRYDRRASLGVSMLQLAMLACAIPCLKITPGDISFHIFQASE